MDSARSKADVSTCRCFAVLIVVDFGSMADLARNGNGISKTLGRLFLRLSHGLELDGSISMADPEERQKAAKDNHRDKQRRRRDRSEREFQRRRQRWLLRICYCKSRDHGRQTAEDDQIPAGVCEKGGHDQSQHRGHEEVSEPASIILVSRPVC